eukprot:CAMPEP_0203701998 /NCGR_PEP_ID=MMETSP0091-20130426/37888_1 /ASSEMBLY_ACC=CAM_ASM_001089 /TAXON_ID=426623 /ORGANISM="Chaetoceros affinis, Strain CCMP159" /LENGTH=47 /DNA_ID= /DNA_START= /DNA_END= /DNA_ORIENTATION=
MVFRYNGKDRVPKYATEVKVDPFVTKIQDRAFFDCSSLASIELTENI